MGPNEDTKEPLEAVIEEKPQYVKRELASTESKEDINRVSKTQDDAVTDKVAKKKVIRPTQTVKEKVENEKKELPTTKQEPTAETVSEPKQVVDKKTKDEKKETPISSQPEQIAKENATEVKKEQVVIEEPDTVSELKEIQGINEPTPSFEITDSKENVNKTTQREDLI